MEIDAVAVDEIDRERRRYDGRYVSHEGDEEQFPERRAEERDAHEEINQQFTPVPDPELATVEQQSEARHAEEGDHPPHGGHLERREAVGGQVVDENPRSPPQHTRGDYEKKCPFHIPRRFLDYFPRGRKISPSGVPTVFCRRTPFSNRLQNRRSRCRSRCARAVSSRRLRKPSRRPTRRGRRPAPRARS